jgi:hypothetical protein
VTRRVRAALAAAAAWVAVAAGGCYAPQIGDGTLGCADGGACPRGFSCGLDRRCWRAPDGHGAQVDVGAGADAGGGDRSMTTGNGGAGGRDGQSGRGGGGRAGGPGGKGGGGSGVDAGADAAPPDAGKKPLGSPCSGPTECSAGFCADGVCCQSACTEHCKACNLTTTRGVCTNVSNGGDSPVGHPSCAATPKAGCLTDGTCDGLGSCRKWNDVVCAPARCDSSTNTLTLEARCDGAGSCTPGPSATCSPFLCATGGAACLTSCTSSTQCVPGSFCTTGSCGPKPLGSPCAGSGECASTLCVDGVCCDGACSGLCEACDTTAAPGHCTAVTSGPPHGARRACGGSGACAGSCAAASRTTCTFPGSATSCRSQSCAGSTLTSAAACDGAGACPLPATSTCGDGLGCNDPGTACLTACRSDADCRAPMPHCQGSACTASRPKGTACASDGDCQSGRCVDGACCDLPCTGQCQACNVSGHAGTCWPIPSKQTPHGQRAACGGQSVCAGFCDGSATECVFPAAETTCSCTVLSGACNGAGQCAVVGGLCL